MSGRNPLNVGFLASQSKCSAVEQVPKSRLPEGFPWDEVHNFLYNIQEHGKPVEYNYIYDLAVESLGKAILDGITIIFVKAV